MASFHNLRTTDRAMSSPQYCAECGISNAESNLESDDDSQVYCSNCWETYYVTLIAASESLTEGPSPAECGSSATESKLENDGDEQYYCSDCWENHFNSLIAALEFAEEEEDSPPSQPASPSMRRLDSMPSLIDDEWPTADVENISVVVPSTKCCFECGASERESKLVLDDDKEYYCTDCRDSFLCTASDDSGTMSEGLGLPD